MTDAACAARWVDYFEPGETLLWEGVPIRDARVTPAQGALALFGLPFLGIGLYLAGSSLWGILTGDARTLAELAMRLFLILFGLPFLGAGAAMVAGPHLAARMAHARVRYAISDRRVYAATRWLRPVMRSWPILPDGAIELKLGRADTVVLRGPDRSRDDDTGADAALENIADGKAVHDLLRRVQAGMAPGRPLR